jgi:hypothetical protein
MDWREDKVLLDGLNGSDWTITTRLWSRLLQVRALPPEQALASWRQIANAPELPGVEMRDVQVAKHYVDKTTSPFG